MNELVLVKSDYFGELECDIYQDTDSEYFMTANQLCECLGEPRSTFDNRINRNQYLTETEFSVSLKMRGTDGKQYETRLFNEDGIYEIAMLSTSDKAKEFRAWIRKILKGLRKKQFQLLSAQEQQRLIAESRLLNAQARKAKEFGNLAAQYRGTEYAQILNSHASKALSGEHILPLPELPERTYTATEIGKMFGVSRNHIGRLANENNLKIPEYGAWFRDVALYRQDKEVSTFRYYANVIPVFERLIADEREEQSNYQFTVDESDDYPF